MTITEGPSSEGPSSAGPISAGPISAGPISDDELTALALAADPDPAIPVDAQPWTGSRGAGGVLPDWYMPAPIAGRRGWRARAVAAVIILSFLAVSGSGLCITYGLLSIA
jgi:hypothetical protein